MSGRALALAGRGACPRLRGDRACLGTVGAAVKFHTHARDDGGGVGSHCAQATCRSQILETAAARRERGVSCGELWYREASTVRAGATLTSCDRTSVV